MMVHLFVRDVTDDGPLVLSLTSLLAHIPARGQPPDNL